MKILKINIEDFGCISKRSFDLADGLNLVLGENESGKSTILSFIKFILYGLPKKNSETAAERMRSISWRSGVALGSMQLEHDGKSYTVTRQGVLRVTAKRESYTEDCTIVDDESGLEVHKGEIPGELFLGVPLSVYESTCFIGQLSASDISSADVSQSLENMLVSADESQSLQKSLDKLDSARRMFKHKTGKGGSLYELEESENDLRARLGRAMSAYNEILAREDSVKDMRESISQKRVELGRVEDTLSALNLVAVANRFDLLHENQGRLDGLKKEKTDFIENSRAADGFLPNVEFANSLAESISSVGYHREKVESARHELDGAQRELDAFSYSSEPLNTEKLKSTHNPEAACDLIEKRWMDSAKQKRSAKALLTVGIILFLTLGAVGGALATLVNLVIGIAIAAVGVLTFVISLLVSSARKKSAAALDVKNESELSEFGFGEIGGEMVDRLVALRRAIRRFFEERSRFDELENNKMLADSVCKMRIDDLGKAEHELELLLAKWNGGAPSPTESLDRARSVISRLASLDSEITYLERTADAMARELSDYNEKDVRARIPESVAQKYSARDIEELDKQKRFLSQSLKLLSDKCISSERELIALENRCENPARLSAEIETTVARRSAEQLKHDAIVMAIEALGEASKNIRSTVTPHVRQRAGEYMAAFTADKYASLGIDDGFNMSTRSGERSHSISLLSAGTKDLAYLSLRLALLSVLYKEGFPPLALDDALTQLDDNRVRNALAVLSKYCADGGQCLLFSCHTREREFLDSEKISANIIQL